jgi:hypothetical protein
LRLDVSEVYDKSGNIANLVFDPGFFSSTEKSAPKANANHCKAMIGETFGP